MRNKKLIAFLIVVLVLVLLIVIFGATFLVRHVDAYSYYEHPQIEEYDKKIIKTAGIELNSSMFFVDEAAIKRKVEEAYPDVGVINIKRSFPDRVTINYVIYEKSFQYRNGGKYYQCYSSGRIGSVSDTELDGYFTVKPFAATSVKIGDYFQSAGGKDRQYIDTIIKFLRDKGMIDLSIIQFIDFIDFRREGYVYIRTKAGCSIEIHDNGPKFTDMLERGFAVYRKADPTVTGVEQTCGLIRVYPNFSQGDGAIRCSYTAPNSDPSQGALHNDGEYYAQYYESLA
ncbi:MAG: FtsQ-type POTRA domain-containing protein [Clostridiales bacterium]|nr:FtsQ-type POTRA domain-containing protein [Clostridiales bacterium]